MLSSKPRNEFEKAATQCQGNFRSKSTTINKSSRSPTPHLHILAPGCGIENLFPGIRAENGAVDFFRERYIQWWKARGYDTKADGPTRHMVSSQIACVNFLLPLVSIPGALEAVLRAIDDDVVDVVNIEYEGLRAPPAPVEFEWTGMGGSLEGNNIRGAQSTSVDAFLVAKTRAGQRRAYLIEWKYTEQYLRTHPKYKGEGSQGDTRWRRYGKHYYGPHTSFDWGAAPKMKEFMYEPFYQLMRQRLLADRMVHKRELGVHEAKIVVVVPKENWAYRALSHGNLYTSQPLAERFPELKTVEEVMRASLKDPDSQFAMVAPSILVDAVVHALPDETIEWANYWRERYGV